jgi:hypothetical protein
MLRTSVTLFAAFGLLAACASSSANQPNTNNPDAGKVDYDVGQPSGGDGGAAGGDSAGDGGASGSTVKGRDSTTTRGNTAGPKVVKRISTTKPAKPEEPATEPAKKPSRKGRVDPNGLLAESFALPAATDKLPADFAALGAPTKLFIATQLASAETSPLPGLPAGTKAPVAFRFTGSLNITEAAEYKLCTSSVDGSQLLLESTVVVDNDGLKKDGAAEVCEIVALDPGEYGLEVRSFHVTGPLIINLTWAKGKDGTAEAIPTRALFKPVGADDRVKAGK